jgi:hypothetical protein
MPAVGDALQFVLASVFEGDAGTRNQVPRWLWPSARQPCAPSRQP